MFVGKQKKNGFNLFTSTSNKMRRQNALLEIPQKQLVKSRSNLNEKYYLIQKASSKSIHTVISYDL